MKIIIVFDLRLEKLNLVKKYAFFQNDGYSVQYNSHNNGVQK